METIAAAMESFLLDCAARQLSAATQRRYRAEIGRLVVFVGEETALEMDDLSEIHGRASPFAGDRKLELKIEERAPV